MMGCADRHESVTTQTNEEEKKESVPEESEFEKRMRANKKRIEFNAEFRVEELRSDVLEGWAKLGLDCVSNVSEECYVTGLIKLQDSMTLKKIGLHITDEDTLSLIQALNLTGLQEPSGEKK
jgi:hypothetical protein